MGSYRLLYDSFFISLETWLLIIFAENSLLCKARSSIVYSILLSLQITRRVVFGKLGSASLLLSLALDVLVIGTLYSGKFRKKLFLIIVFYSINFIFDSAAFLITNFFCSVVAQMYFNNDLFLIETIISKTMVLSAVLLIKDTLKTGNRLREWLKYLPTPVFTIIALVWGSPFTNDADNDDIAKLLIIICVFGFLSNVYLIIHIHRMNEKAVLEYMLKMQKESERLSKEHYIELRNAYSQIDQLAHDIKHHMNYLEYAADLDSVRS